MFEIIFLAEILNQKMFKYEWINVNKNKYL